MPIDLHIHTTCSDGTFTPEEIVSLALGAGLSAIAITDHDAVDGVQRARDASRGAIEVVPGVELSAQTADEADVHLLGYFVDTRAPDLLLALERFRQARQARAAAVVRMLSEAGYDIALEDVLLQAGDGAGGRSHIARALVARGHVPSVETAFREFIGAGGPFYVPKSALSLSEAVALVHRAGGAAVLAHPGVSGDGALMELVGEGLDGIEAYHAEHTARQRDHYRSVASRLGLAVSGGSDYHRAGAKGAFIGAGECPDSALADLRQRASARRS